MRMNDPLLRRYFREIRRWLPCNRRQRKQIIGQIQVDVQNYLAQNPSSDFAQLQTVLGDPQTIAAAYVENADTAELLKSLRIRRRIVTIVTAAVTTILLLWAATVTWAVIREADDSSGGYYEVMIE